jgi:hypothetical protein
MGNETPEGVWKIVSEATEGREEMRLRLERSGSRVMGQVTSPRLGTVEIANGRIEGSRLSWVMPVTGFDIEIEMSVELAGDSLRGESKAGEFGTATLSGLRGSLSDWPAEPHSRHAHRSVVVLPDGTSVIPVSCDADDPYGRDVLPDFGLYLDYRWAPPWEHGHLDWPDFGLPSDPEVTELLLMGFLDRARRGQCVELGCLGGHGRTGTALAWLAVLGGYPPAEAVAWVRANYCDRAVETKEQEAFVAGLTATGER